MQGGTNKERKGRNTTASFDRQYDFAYVNNPKKTTKKFLELISSFKEVIKYSQYTKLYFYVLAMNWKLKIEKIIIKHRKT